MRGPDALVFPPKAFAAHAPPDNLATWLSEAFAYFDAILQHELQYLESAIPPLTEREEREQANAIITGMKAERFFGDWVASEHPDSHPAALITGSPVFHGSTGYVGVSSGEEALARNPAYSCCTFRGSMVAPDVVTGRILWKTFTVPDNKGLPNLYSGNAIWSPPAIDPRRGSLYIGVGNNYTVPDAVLQYQQEAIDSGNQNADCTAPDDHFNTVLALDLRTGAIKWARKLSGFDAWTVACLSLPPGVNCCTGQNLHSPGCD